jgi:hypothetical protein
LRFLPYADASPEVPLCRDEWSARNVAGYQQ